MLHLLHTVHAQRHAHVNLRHILAQKHFLTKISDACTNILNPNIRMTWKNGGGEDILKFPPSQLSQSAHLSSVQWLQGVVLSQLSAQGVETLLQLRTVQSHLQHHQGGQFGQCTALTTLSWGEREGDGGEGEERMIHEDII